MPDSKDDYKIELRDHSAGCASSPALRDRTDQAAKQESTEDARINVAETLRGSHELVRLAREELQGARKDDDGLMIVPQDPALDIRVATCNLRRSLLIMDALLKALEQRGYAVAKGPTVEIRGERLRFGIWEAVEVEKVEPEAHGLAELTASWQ